MVAMVKTDILWFKYVCVFTNIFTFIYYQYVGLLPSPKYNIYALLNAITAVRNTMPSCQVATFADQFRPPLQ